MNFSTFLLRGIWGLGFLIFGLVGVVGQEVQDTVIARRLLNEAIELNKQGKYEEAYAKADSSRGIFAGVLGEETKEVADALFQMGRNQHYLRNYSEAIKIYNTSLMIREKILGVDHLDVALSYNNLGISYYLAGEYNRAIEYHQKSLNIRLKILGKDDEIVASSYLNIGTSYDLKGEYEKAIESYQEALSIKLSAKGEEHEDVLTIYSNLGGSYSSKGNYGKAIGYKQKALEGRLKILGPEHPDVAASLNNLGITHDLMGEYNEAIKYYQKAIEIQLKILGGEHPDLATSYNNLAVCYYSKGEYDKEIDYFQKALKIRLKILGPEHPVVASSLNNLGHSFESAGEYDKAIQYHQKALEIRLKKLGPGHLLVASSYLNLGTSYNLKGESDKAIRYLKKAIEIKLKILGTEHSEVAELHNNIGISFDSKGEYNKAIEYHLKSLKIKIESLGYDHPIVSSSYNNLGISYQSLGEFDKAFEYHQKALEIKLKKLSSIHPEMAYAYNNLGRVSAHKREYIEAISFYKKALAACDYRNGEYLKSNSLEELIKAIIGLSHTFREESYYSNVISSLDQAHSYALQALTAIDYQNSTFTSESTKSFWKTRNYDIYENAIAVTLEKAKVDKDETLRKTTFTYAEKSKASLLQSQIKETDALAFSGIPDSLITKEHDLRIDLTWREKQRQEKLNAGLEETDTTLLAISGKLFDLRQEYEALKTRFEKDYPEYYRLKYDLSTASLAYVQDTLLQPNQTLLEYFVGDSSIYIFTVGKGKYEVTEVKKDFPLEEWVKQLQHGLYGYYGLKKPERTDKIAKQTVLEYADIAPKLYEKLIAPVKDKLTGELIIVPDGVLGYVPFEALLTAPPGQVTNFATYPFLVKDYRISYCYSATLLREMKDKKHKQQPTKSLVAFAPFYEGSYATADSTVSIEFDTLDNGQDTVLLTEVLTRKEYTKLEASGEETATAAKLWKGDYYLNADATEQRFNEVAGDYRIVHLSTHGIADARVGDYSYLAFAEVKDSIENELLYVRDLYNLQLNADLVVLSACETAQGELQRGEGIISLARAFAYAGAKSIVTTLWVVDDTASKDLMKEFYLKLRKGKEGENTKDAALQAAKLKLVNGKDAERKHPFFWAGFIAVGDMSPIK